MPAKAAKSKAEPVLKVRLPVERKRQMEKRAAASKTADGQPMDLSTWVRMVLYRELDKPADG